MIRYKQICNNCGRCRKICPHELQSCDFCGRCEVICPRTARGICGMEFTVDKLFAEIIKQGTPSGVTFSGGECLLQLDFLVEALKKCKAAGVHTAIDTAGYVPFSSFEAVIPYTDMFLYDVKLVNDKLHKKWTGVSNELIFENLKRLSSDFKDEIIIRIPLIGGINDNEEEMRNIAELLKNVRYKGIELLPYQNIGENKCKILGKKSKKFYTPCNIDYFKKFF